jgi:hypothetical protein
MMNQTIYVTKYWRTKGILLQEATKIGANSNKKSRWASARIGYKSYSYYGNDFWLTKEEALAHVAVLLKKKIAAEEKSLKKLKSMQKNLVGLIVDMRKDQL